MGRERFSLPPYAVESEQIEMKDTLVEGAALEAVDIAGVMAMIPHRYPFLLVDRVI